MVKYSYKLWNQSPETAECWHCNKPTLHFLTDLRSGEEIFCCQKCAIKFYKINKIIERMEKHTAKQKSSISTRILHIKNPENRLILGGIQ